MNRIEIDEHTKMRVYAMYDLTGISKLLLHTRAITAWCDGDCMSYVWNWYNPIWIFIVPWAIMAFILTKGVYTTWENRDSLGLGVSDYWRNRMAERVFIRPEHFKLFEKYKGKV